MNDPIVIIINLHNRPNRFLYTLNNLRKVNLNNIIIRKEACSQERAKKEYYKYITMEAYNNINNLKNTIIIPSWGAVACAISHIECYKYIIDNNIKSAIICEDDLSIDNLHKFRLYLNHGMNIIRQNNHTNVFINYNGKELINHVYYYDDDLNNNNNNIEGLFPINNFFKNSQFYMINNKMAKTLFSNLIQIKYQIDVQISVLLKQLDQ